jgi:hypothetical protein
MGICPMNAYSQYSRLGNTIPTLLEETDGMAASGNFLRLWKPRVRRIFKLRLLMMIPDFLSLFSIHIS